MFKFLIANINYDVYYNKMKIIKEKNILKTPYLNIIETEYINTNNKKSKWFHAERTNNQKGVMIAATIKDKLVVIKEFRVPLKDYEWNFPAGLIDEGENIETAAKREFNEETGLEILKINKISPFVYNTAGLSNESISIVFVEATGNIDYSKNEASEDITVYLMSKNEVKKLLQNTNDKISAKAWLIFDNFVNS